MKPFWCRALLGTLYCKFNVPLPTMPCEPIRKTNASGPGTIARKNVPARVENNRAAQTFLDMFRIRGWFISVSTAAGSQRKRVLRLRELPYAIAFRGKRCWGDTVTTSTGQKMFSKRGKWRKLTRATQAQTYFMEEMWWCKLPQGAGPIFMMGEEEAKSPGKLRQGPNLFLGEKTGIPSPGEFGHNLLFIKGFGIITELSGNFHHKGHAQRSSTFAQEQHFTQYVYTKLAIGPCGT